MNEYTRQDAINGLRYLSRQLADPLSGPELHVSRQSSEAIGLAAACSKSLDLIQKEPLKSGDHTKAISEIKANLSRKGKRLLSQSIRNARRNPASSSSSKNVSSKLIRQFEALCVKAGVAPDEAMRSVIENMQNTS